MLHAISAAVACILTLILWAVLAIVLIHNQPTTPDPFSIAASSTPFSQAYIEIVIFTAIGVATPVITSASTGSAPGRFGLSLVMTAYVVALPWLAVTYFSDANVLIWLAAGLALIAALKAAFPGPTPERRSPPAAEPAEPTSHGA
jgi:hypothetical protein